MDSREQLETVTIGLLRTQPFFASLLLRCHVEFSERIPTAGVYVKEKINMIINPKFFDALKYEERISVVIHEMYHCINNHFGRYKNNDKQLFNVAADIAINQYIKNIPQEFQIQGRTAKTATIENFKKNFPKLKAKESTEYYYKEIYEQIQKNKGSGSDGKDGEPIDDHEIWGEGYESEEVVKQVLTQSVNSAVEEAKKHTNGIGSIPSEVLLAIDELNRSVIDWKNVLRKFVANSSEVFKTPTRTKRNRRYGLLYPGDKTECKTNIVSIVDTSGSMSAEQLAEINGEMMALVNNQVEVTLVQCDAAVHGVEKFKKSTNVQFKGGGGTSMIPGFKEAMKHQPDAIICFTDGYIGEINNPKVPTLWIINNGDRNFNPGFGKIIHIQK